MNEMLEELFEKSELDNSYLEDDITVATGPASEKYVCTVINFPEPESVPLCYCSIILFDEKVENLHYFTFERNVDGGTYICSWRQGDNGLIHMSHGDYNGAEDGIVDYLISIYEGLRDWKCEQ